MNVVGEKNTLILINKSNTRLFKTVTTTAALKIDVSISAQQRPLSCLV